MKTADIINTRAERFDREFPKISRREHWMTMYLELREAGDDHLTAVETIRAERWMETLTRP